MRLSATISREDLRSTDLSEVIQCMLKLNPGIVKFIHGSDIRATQIAIDLAEHISEGLLAKIGSGGLAEVHSNLADFIKLVPPCEGQGSENVPPYNELFSKILMAWPYLLLRTSHIKM